MTTYASLDNCKDELTLAYSVSTNDTELTNLLTMVDGDINRDLQRYTSLPLQTEISAQLADIEARWVALRFRFRRATPQEQNQYQAALKNIKDEFEEFLKNNFQKTFRTRGSMTDKPAPVDYGQFNNQDS
ncbi:MAG: hypothetical protein ACREBQ_12100, partial [Nitrososphaerales archaeon]